MDNDQISLNWQPTATWKTVHLRAELYREIRQFFAKREVLEVETPIFSSGSVPEPLIEPFATVYQSHLKKRFFLQTSPELAMKRLLAAGSGPIFQLCKVFRDDEQGRWHSPEFTLLEWYRPGFTTADLIQEVDEFLQVMLHTLPAQVLTYCQVFQKYTGLHPLFTELGILQQYIGRFGVTQPQEWDRDSCLHLIISHEIEPHLGHEVPVVMTDFPATQAALARKKCDNPMLAERFEFYVQGVELANGFDELTDAVEQRQRFEQDLKQRKTLGLPTYPLDERFLAALEAGLPACAGVALGIDRLLMLKIGASHINEVLTFPIE